MQKLKQFISGDDGEEGLLDDEESDSYCSLSPTQRMYAFAACLVAGLASMFLSVIVLLRPIKFAVLFTFGNLLAVGSTAFLIGPAQQLRMMFDSARIYATAVYIGFVVMALICALWIVAKMEREREREKTGDSVCLPITGQEWPTDHFLVFPGSTMPYVKTNICDRVYGTGQYKFRIDNKWCKCCLYSAANSRLTLAPELKQHATEWFQRYFDCGY
ncbi:Vesicle transport protein SFT2A, putative [Ricinus communis]|uniref:Vesicle transport protein n=1 Tax=Ricinus communis TaxID=3988 RepID=B9RII4_RICCO|nr:Vesicle transport protein SFT2A, putative [Ricinus communis]